MAQQRRKAREIALQVLYGLEVFGPDTGEAIGRYWQHFGAPEECRAFSTLLIEATWDHRGQIDGLIGSCSENWSLPRMARVDKSILRMAVCELLYFDDIPPKVTINEAIDLGKIYGSENSGAFINGILDALYARLRREHADQNRKFAAGTPDP